MSLNLWNKNFYADNMKELFNILWCPGEFTWSQRAMGLIGVILLILACGLAEALQ